jgi:hypothetical protein
VTIRRVVVANNSYDGHHHLWDIDRTLRTGRLGMWPPERAAAVILAGAVRQERLIEDRARRPTVKT